jgi:hypothetical protein
MTRPHPLVDVLLATYNGARYLDEWLASLFSQTVSTFRLIVRDDGSRDATMTLLHRWKERYPQQILLLASDRHLGVVQTFATLVASGSAPYLMLADQDDVWFVDKIEKSLARLVELEQKFSSTMPILIHTDLQVVDQHLREIAPSFWNYSKIDPKTLSLSRLLTQNGVTGCTACFNRALATLALPFPDHALMHDAWLALVAASHGVIDFISTPTLAYRQHGTNCVGAQSASFFSLARRHFTKGNHSARHSLQLAQASFLLERYGHSLPPASKKKLEIYLSLPQRSYLTQKILILKHRFFKQGILRNGAHLLLPGSV